MSWPSWSCLSVMVLRGLWKCYLLEFGLCYRTTGPFTHPSSLVGGLQKLVSFFHSRSLITKSWSVPWADCEGKGCLQLENVENISSLLLSQWASIRAYSAAHKICIWIYYHIWPENSLSLAIHLCMWFIQHLRSLHFAASSRLAQITSCASTLCKVYSCLN